MDGPSFGYGRKVGRGGLRKGGGGYTDGELGTGMCLMKPRGGENTFRKAACW